MHKSTASHGIYPNGSGIQAAGNDQDCTHRKRCKNCEPIVSAELKDVGLAVQLIYRSQNLYSQ